MDYIEGKLSNIGSINQALEDIEELKVKKQDKLVSGENIKKINNNSLLGDGNLSVGVLTSNLIVTHTVGGVTAGAVFPAGTSIENIIRAILG